MAWLLVARRRRRVGGLRVGRTDPFSDPVASWMPCGTRPYSMISLALPLARDDHLFSGGTGASGFAQSEPHFRQLEPAEPLFAPTGRPALGRVDLIDGVPVVLSESARHSPGCV